MLEKTLTKTADQPGRKRWTYADYCALPNDGKRYEIIKGVLYVANAPSAEHQAAVTEITTVMNSFVKKQQLGRVLVAPFEVHLSEDSRPVQPDILFVKADRWPAGPVKIFTGAPDLIVEVISPNSARLDRVIKFADYEEAGVTEYWLVNPHTKIVEIYTLSGGEYALVGEYAGDEPILSNVLIGIEITANVIFA